jgi:hypothetical protein
MHTIRVTCVVAAACAAAVLATGAAASPSSSFPQGRFQAMFTGADVVRAPALGRRWHTPADPAFAVQVVLSFRNGRWSTDEAPERSGRYVVDGKTISLVVDAPLREESVRQTLMWSYANGRLRLRAVAVADAGSHALYTLHSWRRIGA